MFDSLREPEYRNLSWEKVRVKKIYVTYISFIFLF